MLKQKKRNITQINPKKMKLSHRIFTIVGTIFATLAVMFAYSEYELYIMNNNPVIEIAPIDQLKKLIIEKGDTIAYQKIRNEFLYKEYYRQEHLLYSILMANKYNYPPAYYYVYEALTSMNDLTKNAGENSTENKKMALNYLIEGAGLDDRLSVKELYSLYLKGEYVPESKLIEKQFIEKAKLFVSN